MHGIGRNDADGAWPKHLRDPIHDNFKLTFESVRDLFDKRVRNCR